MSIKSGIRNLDIFLDSIGQSLKKLPRDLVENWIKQLHPLKNVTIKWNVIVVRQFLFYLHSLGIDVYIPDVPAYRSDHIPYAFSDEELVLLFAASDNLQRNSLMDTCLTSFAFMGQRKFPLSKRFIVGLKTITSLLYSSDG